MDSNLAKEILSNLRERIESGVDGRYRLDGVITKRELEALDFLISNVLDERFTESISTTRLTLSEQNAAPEVYELPTIRPAAEIATEVEISLDLSIFDLPASSLSYRVCLDFGTAMSKATFVCDNKDADFEEIRVLRLGVPGDQEEVDEVMLVSSLFIDMDGRLWFGQRAIEQAQAASDSGISRLDNIKRWLSEGNLNTPVDRIYNPTAYNITYEDLVLAYLVFFTWTVNKALAQDAPEMSVPRNFRRRFAMPCFPRANAKLVELKLFSLLGEAQVISDNFKDEIHKGLPLGLFMSAIKKLRANLFSYDFIEGSITEPLGVAGSLLSWRSSHDSLVLVVDIGAGTSDFSLYRLSVSLDDDGEVDGAKTIALEVDGSARGITEAGNHLDSILKAFILSRAGITSEHPAFMGIAYDLERSIRSYKETLFNTGSVFVVLYNDEALEIFLDEFILHDAVKAFENSLAKTLIEVLESVNSEFINWVRVNPSRSIVVVLTGGGAALPMAKKLAMGPIFIKGSSVAVAAAQTFPAWLQQDYPDLEDHYPRIAVSLGGARKNVIQSRGVAKTTGSGLGGHVLDRF